MKKIIFRQLSRLCSFIIIFLCIYSSHAEDNIQKLKALYARPTDIPFPEDNEYSPAKETLGRMLFFDPRLSRSQVMSCATCHNPSFAWGDRLIKGVGDFHKELGRRTPTILNLAWDELFFWDGRADSLETQALGPIASTAEMGMALDIMVENLHRIKGYKFYFTSAFPNEDDPISKENVAKAIATFERTVVSGTSPFDKWVEGDAKAITKSAKKGFALFNGKANCAICHSGWNFSDNSFHDIGVDSPDIGRYKVLEMDSMQYAFKTPGLRNIAQRFPYMHDGSQQTLMDVINHYNDGFIKRPSLSENIKPLALTEKEKKNIVDFLKTLTSKDSNIILPVLPQ